MAMLAMGIATEGRSQQPMNGRDCRPAGLYVVDGVIRVVK
jgi:hypothetical protein